MEQEIKKYEQYLQQHQFEENTKKQYTIIIKNYLTYLQESNEKETIETIKQFITNRNYKDQKSNIWLLSVLRNYFKFSKNKLLFEIDNIDFKGDE